MSGGSPSPPPLLVPVVDTVLRLDPHTHRAVVAAVVSQLAAEPSRAAALRADLAAHPEYLTGGSTRSQEVTQEFARALFAVGVRGVALPRCEWCRSTSPMVVRLSTNGGGACSRCARRMTTSRCSRCAVVAPRGGRSASGRALCERCAELSRDARCPTCGTSTRPCRRPEHGAVRCPDCRPPGARHACPSCPQARAPRPPRPSRPPRLPQPPRTPATPEAGRSPATPKARRLATPRARRPAAPPKALRRCDRCGRLAPVAVRLGYEELCHSCRCLPQRICRACEHPRPHTSQDPCPRCGEPASHRCGHCGDTLFSFARDPLAEAGRRCQRCQLRARITSLLTRPEDGLVDERLLGFVTVLGDVASPRTALTWLQRGRSRDLLVELAHGRLSLTHEALDEQAGPQRGRANAVEHLRQLLVSSGALPARDEHLSRLERTLVALIGHAHPDDAVVLRRYAAFQVLPGVRRRLARGGDTVGVCHAAGNALRRVARLQAWLRGRDVELRQLPQAVLDEWAAQHPGNVRDVAAFLSWARGNRLTGQAALPDRRRWGPTTFLPTQDRWRLAQRLLHDDDLHSAHRLAGCLVLLYGQPVRRLVGLRRSDITTSSGRTTISLGSEALLLAPPLDQLARELAAGSSPDPTILGLAQSFPSGQQWLFPGRRAGQPIGDKGLWRRLTKLGIPIRGARNSALLELARDVPPSILADLLGLTPEAVDRWRELAGGSWTSYAAGRGQQVAQ